MEPLQSAAVAVALLILKSAVGRIGEILTDRVFEEVSQSLNNNIPKTVIQRNLAVETIIELMENPKNAEAVEIFFAEVKNTDPKIAEAVDKIRVAQTDDQINQSIQKLQQQELPKQTDISDNNTFKITMLGARGVGKTSTLTAMYEKLNAFRNILNIEPVGGAKTILFNRSQDLKRLAKSPAPINNIQATRGETTFTFNIENDKKIVFQDYPGEYLTDPEKQQQVKGYMAESNVVIIPIDALGLMENDSKWNEHFNKIQDITNMFDIVYRKNTNTKQLVVFTIIKCEKYISISNLRKEPTRLKETFVNQYERLISFLAESPRLDNISIVFMPIHTLGCSILKRIVEEEGKPKYEFSTLQELANYGISSEYAPEGGDQILKYILRFMYRLYQSKQTPWYQRDIIEWLFNPNRNSALQTAVNKFIEENRELDQWAVLQGGKLLGIN